MISSQQKIEKMTQEPEEKKPLKIMLREAKADLKSKAWKEWT